MLQRNARSAHKFLGGKTSTWEHEVVPADQACLKLDQEWIIMYIIWHFRNILINDPTWLSQWDLGRKTLSLC